MYDTISLIIGGVTLIKCNLAMLLAERGLKITKVSNDTGISRTTLTALSNNTSQGIQLETIDKLCIYLKCAIKDFFIFHPSNIICEMVKNSDFIILEVTTENYCYRVLTHASQFIHESDPSKVHITIFIMDVENLSSLLDNSNLSLFGENEADAFFDAAERFPQYYKNLPIPFKTDLESKLLEMLKDHFSISTKQKTFFSIDWGRN